MKFEIVLVLDKSYWFIHMYVTCDRSSKCRIGCYKYIVVGIFDLEKAVI